MEKIKTNQAAKLAGYSAAVAMGAFGVSSSAEGAIVYTDLIPDATASSGNDVEIDYDGDGARDVLFRIINGGVRSYGGDYGDDGVGALFTDTEGGTKNTYYIRGFELDDLIGPTTTLEAGPNIMAGNPDDFGGGGHYLGVQFIFGGATHYGWVGVEVSGSTGTIRDYAYENVADTAIAAGAVPEPSSLALLAAGAGSLALRRRRDVA